MFVVRHAVVCASSLCIDGVVTGERRRGRLDFPAVEGDVTGFVGAAMVHVADGADIDVSGGFGFKMVGISADQVVPFGAREQHISGRAGHVV